MISSLLVLMFHPALAQIEIKATDITGAITDPEKEAKPSVARGPGSSRSPVTGWGLSGMNAGAYQIAKDSEVKHGGEFSGAIRCKARKAA